MKGRKWQMLEVSLTTDALLENPFWDVELKGVFRHAASSVEQSASGFYDGSDGNGRHTWKIRWTPAVEGSWTFRASALPATPGLSVEMDIEVEPEDYGSKGMLRAVPSENFGFRFDNGEPFFLFGDTMYNLFGAHYCGVNVDAILKHRKSQGINYIRARVPVSAYHPVTSNQWQTKDCWPWGGSSQMPDFMRLQLKHFRAVDEVVSRMAELGMGLEMILQGWLFEFPFNDRGKFVAEYEEFWNRYIVSRYAAYPSIYVWCPANEYEFYPSGMPGKYHKESNRWMKRLSDMIRSADPYAHPIGAHNWEKTIPMPERLSDCANIEVYLVQTEWGKETERFTRNASLCKGLESDLRVHAGNPNMVTVCAEFGYEKTEGLLTAPGHRWMDRDHTRRGQWRAGFSGFTVVHGFDNTWGAHMRIDVDSAGASDLPHYFRFMTEMVNFANMRPSPERLAEVSRSEQEGTLPLCLSDADGETIAVYFPAPNECRVRLEKSGSYLYQWYNPRTGEAGEQAVCDGERAKTPLSADGTAYGDDWVLLIQKAVQ